MALAEVFIIQQLSVIRLVVLESGLGLESGLKYFLLDLDLDFGSKGLGLELGLESYGLELGLGGSARKSFFQVLFVPTKPIAL